MFERDPRGFVMMKTVLKIEGMTCDHCVRSVHQALSRVPGVVKVQVRLDPGQAVLESEGPLDVPLAVRAVEEEGYRAYGA